MKYITLFIIIFVLWLLITFNLETPNLIVGALVALLTSLVFGKSFLKDSKKFFQLQRYFWIIIYLVIFIWECIKANLDVAYRVLSPSMPIKPGIVKVKTALKTDIGKTFLANSITMTPGTITVDIIDDEFYIHWIFVSSKEPEQYTNKILGRFEKYIKRIFE
ncbi:MAG: Na+/H+ antiporter subunit E [Candidatus Tenebribacter mawsonii]|nr:Na+/H+ antiporter subunit E [Candidatus Tenebribacter mawsonii]